MLSDQDTFKITGNNIALLHMAENIIIPQLLLLCCKGERRSSRVNFMFWPSLRDLHDSTTGCTIWKNLECFSKFVIVK